MRIKIAAVIAAISLMMVGGCSDPHKNEHCVAHQRELWYIQHTKITRGITISQPVYHTVCTQWVHN